MKGFIVAGTHSGAGKTTITLGLMAALKRMGYRVVPFKCGPDFIDPSLHTLITGEVSRNLDIWMAGTEHTRSTFFHHLQDDDIAIVEGVMGMFDGGISSSAALAGELDLPLLLVIDARSLAESAAAIVKGFESLDPKLKIAGVICNRIGSPRHLQLVADAIASHCKTPLIGYLPRAIEFTIPSRHLGLHMGDDLPVSPADIETLATTISDHIDINRLLLFSDLEKTGRPPAPDIPVTGNRLRIAVARDRAFCFYYQDNFDLLTRHGAEIVFFSPLNDRGLPQNIDALYLGGGYPELYGAALSANTTMLEEIHAFHAAGLPIYAECGGFMYLTEGITDGNDLFHPLAGIFPTRAAMQTTRASLGYRELTTTTSSCWGPAGTVLHGHEFHYSRISRMGPGIERIYSTGDALEGYRTGNTIGGYIHLHFGYNEDALAHFIQHCRG